MDKSKQDIPISAAIICFNESSSDVLVLSAPDMDRFRDSYTHIFGACDPYWVETDLNVLCGELLIYIWHAVVLFGVSPKALNDALMVIPEYRMTLPEDAIPKAYRRP